MATKLEPVTWRFCAALICFVSSWFWSTRHKVEGQLKWTSYIHLLQRFVAHPLPWHTPHYLYPVLDWTQLYSPFYFSLIVSSTLLVFLPFFNEDSYLEVLQVPNWWGKDKEAFSSAVNFIYNSIDNVDLNNHAHTILLP